MEEATYQFSVQAAGGLAGSLVSGFLADRYDFSMTDGQSFDECIVFHCVFQAVRLTNIFIPFHKLSLPGDTISTISIP